jgi:hypothetical protein
VQRWRESRGAKLMKWPREAMEEWGGWFLFGLFAAILIWWAGAGAREEAGQAGEELWGGAGLGGATQAVDSDASPLS